VTAAPDARPSGETRTAVDRAVDTITEEVRQGRLVPGQRLVEADLMQTLRVGRGSVREALRRLEAQGVVESTTHRGSRIRPIDRDELQEIYEARSLIESEAARRAARRIGRGDNRAHLQAALTGLREVRAGDVLGYIDNNTVFHSCVLTISDNRQFRAIVESINLWTLRYSIGRLIAGAITDIHQEHEQVAARILAGDETGAAEAMRTHVDNTGKLALNRLDSR
jgi:DNA-binding GntR family transcriptional regulator